MATEEDAVGWQGGDGGRGVDGGVALAEDHAGHVARNEVTVFRAGRGGAPLRCDEAITLDLRRELLHSGGLKAGEDERRFDGRESRAGGESEAWGRFLQGGAVDRERSRFF